MTELTHRPYRTWGASCWASWGSWAWASSSTGPTCTSRRRGRLTRWSAGQERHDDRPGGHRLGHGGLRRRRAGDERRGGIAGGPQRARSHRRRRLDRRKGGSYERTRGADPRAGRGQQGAAGVHLPAGRSDDGGVRPVLRRIPLRPLRPVRGEDGAGRPPGSGGDRRRGRADRRQAVASGGRRPFEVSAGGAALRRAGVRAGAERAARADPAR